MNEIPLKRTTFRKFNGRLALFRNWTNTSTDWDALWLEGNIKRTLEKKNVGLGELGVIEGYLSADQNILEAGCGSGWVVRYLAQKGYSVEGIDFAEKTIGIVNQVAPYLNIHYGDIYGIDAKDNTYGAYISLGVLEHNPEGPILGLKEAYRVLQPYGLGFFNIPCLNHPRKRLLAKCGDASDLGPDFSFYQYYYSKTEFAELLNQAGFDIIETIPNGLFYGLRSDNPIFKFLESKNFFHWRIRRRVYSSCQKAPLWTRKKYGHMIMYICKKQIG